MTSAADSATSGVLVHLGAGPGRDLSAHLQGGFERLVLVEALPEHASELSKHTRGRSDVKVLALAVGPEAAAPGSPGGILRVMSFADQSSLRPPTALTDYLPGVRLVRELPVEVAPVAEIVRREVASPSLRNVLIIDTPGVELDLILALRKENLLRLFGEVRVHCARSPVFDGAAGMGLVLDSLEAATYDILPATLQDADFPFRVARIDEQRLVKKQANAPKAPEARVPEPKLATPTGDQAASAKSTAAKSVDASVDVAKRLANELAETKSRSDAEFARLEAEFAAERDRLRSVIQALQAELNAEKTGRAAEVERLSAEISDLKTKLDEHAFRSPLVDNELLRLTAQLDLIKDVLIRDKVF